MTIAMGVIILSVIISYVVLPIIAPKHASAEKQEEIKRVQMGIFTAVADALEAEATVKNKEEFNLIAYRYRDRADDVQMTMRRNSAANDEINVLNRKIVDWKIENLENMEKDGKITREEADYYIKSVDRERRKKISRGVTGTAIAGFFNSRRLAKEADKISHGKDDVFLRSSKANAEYVLEKLEGMKKAAPSAVVDAAVQKYQYYLSNIQQNIDKNEGVPIDEDILTQVERRAIQIETGFIQDEYEKGNLSYSDSRNMKSDLALLSGHLL